MQLFSDGKTEKKMAGSVGRVMALAVDAGQRNDGVELDGTVREKMQRSENIHSSVVTKIICQSAIR